MRVQRKVMSAQRIDPLPAASLQSQASNPIMQEHQKRQAVEEEACNVLGDLVSALRTGSRESDGTRPR